MRYNCDTKHGMALIIAKANSSDARAIVQWGHPGVVRQIEYVFTAPPPSTHAAIAEEVIARLSAAHFDRTAAPVEATLHFQIIDIEPNGELRLIPLS